MEFKIYLQLPIEAIRFDLGLGIVNEFQLEKWSRSIYQKRGSSLSEFIGYRAACYSTILRLFSKIRASKRASLATHKHTFVQKARKRNESRELLRSSKSSSTPLQFRIELRLVQLPNHPFVSMGRWN